MCAARRSEPWGRGTRRVLRWTGFLILISAAIYLLISPRVAERLVFYPDSSDPGEAPTLGGIQGRDVTLESADGVQIHAWWWEVDPPAPAVVFFHGNAGNIAMRVPTARELVDRGISVLLVSYRGYGLSHGSPSEEGVLKDGIAALEWVSREVGGSERVVLHGRSLGGFVAAGVGSRRPMAGVVLESSFTTLRDMARQVYPFIPSFFLGRLEGHFNNVEAVQRIEAPLLVIHGERDNLIPAEMGERLYSEAGDPRQWYLVPGAGHNDLPIVGGHAYFDEVARFVHRSTAGSDAS